MKAKYEFIVSTDEVADGARGRLFLGQCNVGPSAQDDLEMILVTSGADEEIAECLASQAIHSDGNDWSKIDNNKRMWYIELSKKPESQCAVDSSDQ